MNNKNIGIILAGEIGSRFKGDKPKQYYLINGKEMIWYSIDAFFNASTLDDFIVIVDENEFINGRIGNTYGVKTVLGGATRNQSLKNALDCIKLNYPHCEKVIENNSACPLITSKVIDNIVGLLDNNDFVQCAYRITDALGSYSQKKVDRDDYFLIQSPDAYRFKLLYEHFDANNKNGHPAMQLPDNAKGCNYYDFIPNIKVTYPEDIHMVEFQIKNRINQH